MGKQDLSKVNLQGLYSLEGVIHQCQTLGMRVSKQRRYILELLWSTPDHLSARQIYDQLNQNGKSIGHTSVYQNLEALFNHGLVECIDRSGGRLYGSRTDLHSHIYCLDSDTIFDIKVELPEDLVKKIEAQTGMQIQEYRIDFFAHKK